MCRYDKNSDLASSLKFAGTKAFSLRRRCPEGADEVEKVTISSEFSQEREPLPHTSSVGFADSFSSRRSLGLYHAFGLFDKSELIGAFAHATKYVIARFAQANRGNLMCIEVL